MLNNFVSQSQEGNNKSHLSNIKPSCGTNGISYCFTENTTLSSNTFLLKKHKIYPNPSSSKINVSKVEDIETYTLLNFIGKVIS